MNRALASYETAEERNKLSHFTVQGFDLHGVIHGGANDGEEIHNYIRMGIDFIIGFEPMSGVFEKLREDCARWPGELGIYPKQLSVYKLALHDKNGKLPLHRSVGDGKGSTLFDVNYEHAEVVKNWNQGQGMFEGDETVRTVRFDSWATKTPEVNLVNYDTLLLDTQGNEFEILKGMGTYLKGFKYLCIELSTEPAYKQETPAQAVSDWLATQGFIQDSPLYSHNDAFFIRKDIKPESDRQYRGRC